tara:strand:+ start:999 stop:2123 length:1125 start_codon:yes stop_codon:yes gene_type:complete
VPSLQTFSIAFGLWIVLVYPGFTETDRQRDGLRGSVREVILVYEPKGKNSHVVKKTLYDLRGNRTWQTTFKKSGEISNRTKRVFNSSERKIEEFIFDADEILLSLEVWKFDPKGHMIERRRLDGSRSEILIETWSFDSAGHLLQMKKEAPQRPQKNQTIHINYDETGKPLSKIRFDYKGTPFQKRIFLYRTNGNLRREIVLKSDMMDGTKIERIIENKVYNKVGHLTSITLFSPKGDFLRSWSYLYNDSGNKTKETLYLKPGKIENQWLYFYDSRNDLPIESRFIRNGDTTIIKPFKGNGSNGTPQKLKETKLWKRIEKKDEQGNWTQTKIHKRRNYKALYKPVGTYTRSIRYFPKNRDKNDEPSPAWFGYIRE